MMKKERRTPEEVDALMERLGDSNMGDPYAPADDLDFEVAYDRGVVPGKFGGTAEDKAGYAAYHALRKAKG